MENYPSYSYPDSGDSSPRSREIDFDNPPPSWEDPNPSMNTNTNTKVKFMVSYGGKIQPRTLSYVGGETKILSVDRNIKFSTLYSKLSSMLLSDTGSGLDPGSGPGSGSGFTLKYQLPGEDLDALISVTNDDDLENMMHEYDRLCRGSSKPARLRIFLFTVQRAGSFGSASSERELDRFGLEKTGSVPVSSHSNPTRTTQTYPAEDYLFGLEKTGSVPVQVPVLGPAHVETDPQIDARIQELNRMQISGQEVNRVKSDDGGGFSGGAPAGIPVGYWQQQQVPPPQQPPQIQSQQPVQHFQHHPQLHHQNQQIQQQPPQAPPQQQQQPVYMVHAPPQQGNIYHAPHAPIMRPVGGQQGQGQIHGQSQGGGGGGGYYQVQRVGSDQIYRDQPVYGVGPGGKMMGGGGGYSEGMGLPVRPVVSGGIESNVGYQQVHTTTTQYSPTEMGYQHVAAYDSGSGRQVYYAAPHPGGGGVVTTPFQGVAVSGSGELRTVGSSNVPGDHKVVQK